MSTWDASSFLAVSAVSNERHDSGSNALDETTCGGYGQGTHNLLLSLPLSSEVGSVVDVKLDASSGSVSEYSGCIALPSSDMIIESSAFWWSTCSSFILASSVMRRREALEDSLAVDRFDEGVRTV